jgi:hypothetical protein
LKADAEAAIKTTPFNPSAAVPAAAVAN